MIVAPEEKQEEVNNNVYFVSFYAKVNLKWILMVLYKYFIFANLYQIYNYIKNNLLF
jgi:hypothetical protein